jgi:hypothetical protein
MTHRASWHPAAHVRHPADAIENSGAQGVGLQLQLKDFS